MADSAEKTAPTENVQTPPHSVEHEDVQLPRGWMYQKFKIGRFAIPWYASPETQLLLVAFVCFLCPGMFNAVNGLGGGGQFSAKVSSDSNTALYSAFAVVGFFAGTITNTIGIKFALSFGGIGYCIYISSYLCYNYTENYGYPVFAGFVLGCCAGVLWAAQGAIMMSYPLEKDKGRYISWFWIIFNLGGVLGGLIPLGQNIDVSREDSKTQAVTNGTYIAFLVLTFLGAVLAWTLCDAKNVIRKDGSRIIMMKHPTWQSELLGMYETFKSDFYIVLLFPMFFTSNWFYTYHFNDVNLANFDIRTRGLNSVLYWTAQMIGATIFGYALDYQKIRRRTRAKAVWVAMFVLTFAIWGGGYAYQKGYTRASAKASLPLDWTTSGYVGPMFLYIFYGMYDAAFQTTVYWYMGSLSNNSRKLANFAGFYKGLQSAGAAITWRIDGMDSPPSYMATFASCWGLLGASFVVAAPVLWWKIQDTVPIEEDVKFTDETVEDVLRNTSISGETSNAEKV